MSVIGTQTTLSVVVGSNVHKLPDAATDFGKLKFSFYFNINCTIEYHMVIYNDSLQRGIFVIIMGSPDLKKRSDLIGISEKQGTCSRT